MKIYMDTCCLNRPFDDQSNPRIRLESEAIKTIITFVEKNVWSLVGSFVLDFEIKNISDDKKYRSIKKINTLSSYYVKATPQIQARARKFEKIILQAFDATHLASAEGNADILLTTDDRFIKRSKNIKDLEISVENPLKWLEEVLP